MALDLYNAYIPASVPTYSCEGSSDYNYKPLSKFLSNKPVNIEIGL